MMEGLVAPKIYLAAPLFTPHQIDTINYLKKYLEYEVGAKIFSPYHASREIWAGRKPADCSPEERALVLNQNIINLHWCDILVSWLQREDSDYNGRTDTGVAWEMGYLNCLSRRNGGNYPVSIGYIHPHDPLPPSGVNIMLSQTIDAVVAGPKDLKAAILLATVGKFDHMREQFSIDKLNLEEKD